MYTYIPGCLAVVVGGGGIGPCLDIKVVYFVNGSILHRLSRELSR